MSDTKTWKTLDWSTATVDDVKHIIANGGKINEEVIFVSGKWREESFKCRSPLGLATEAANEDVVAFLLQNGANPNQIVRDTHHYWGEVNVKPLPLLTLAIETGNQRIIDLYFKHGVNPYDIGEKETKTTDPFMKRHEQYEYEKQVIGWTHPLTVAIAKGNKKLMNKILKDYEIPEQQKKIFQWVFDSRVKDAEEFHREKPEHDLYRMCLAHWNNPSASHTENQESSENPSVVKKFIGKMLVWAEVAEQWLKEAKASAKFATEHARKALQDKQKGGNE